MQQANHTNSNAFCNLSGLTLGLLVVCILPGCRVPTPNGGWGQNLLAPNARNTAATSQTTTSAWPSQQQTNDLSNSATIRGQNGTLPNDDPNEFNRYIATKPQQGTTGNLPVPAPAGSLPLTDATNPQAVPQTGYAAPGPLTDYGTSPSNLQPNTLAPGATLPPGSLIGPNPLGPQSGFIVPAPQRRPPKISPLDIYVQEARTGSVVIGGSVNSDLGVAGQIIISERNFDLFSPPRSWGDVMSGNAFRGGGQNFRLELMPGSQVQRYTVNWSQRNLLGYLPYSLSVGGFLFTRQFRDWTEQRLGGRVALGYEITKDLTISSELRMEDVKLFDPRFAGIAEIDDALGSNDIYTARFRVARDTRDNIFMPSEGSLLELVFDQVFGEYDYSRGRINYSSYRVVRERPDGRGRHTLATTLRVGLTGSQTPVFENFFAGGFSTLRGFSFRGASPVVGGAQVGGELSFLGSFEYIFPLTADEMLRGVAFVDYGTVERDIEFNSDNFRVAPGLGLRVSVPALGAAPLAFDFAYPLNYADNDDRQVFSFHMGFTR